MQAELLLLPPISCLRHLSFLFCRFLPVYWDYPCLLVLLLLVPLPTSLWGRHFSVCLSASVYRSTLKQLPISVLSLSAAVMQKSNKYSLKTRVLSDLWEHQEVSEGKWVSQERPIIEL